MVSGWSLYLLTQHLAVIGLANKGGRCWWLAYTGDWEGIRGSLVPNPTSPHKPLLRYAAANDSRGWERAYMRDYSTFIHNGKHSVS